MFSFPITDKNDLFLCSLTLKNYFGICITTTIFMGINIPVCRAIKQEGSVELPFFLVLL